MRLQKLSDETGSSALEFVVLTGIVLGPLLAVQQDLTQLHLRQVALDGLVQDVAREFSLNRDPSQAEMLVQQLAIDANFESEPDLRIDCEPDPSCSNWATEVKVSARHKGLRATTFQALRDEGSGSVLIIGLFGLAILVIFLGANLQAANLLEFRAKSVARYLVSSHYFDTMPPSPYLLVSKSRAQVTSFGGGVEIFNAEFTKLDAVTAKARVCLRQRAPIGIVGFSSRMQACASAMMRFG